MIEFLFIVAVIVLFFWFKAKARLRSTEFGVEARHIACHELGVPLSAFNFMVQNEIEEIKKASVKIQQIEPFYRSMSWPRLLAWTIYGGYRYDCQRAYFDEDSKSIARLQKYGVTNKQIEIDANSPHKAEGKLTSSQ